MKAILVLVCVLVASPVAAQDGPFEIFNRDLYFGRPTQFDAIQDFAFDLNDFAIKGRKVLVGDVGNPGQLFLRSAGPDNSPFDGRPGRLAPNKNIGHIAWQARTDTGWDGRNAQIYARSVGEQTPTTAAGSLHFATTPVDPGDMSHFWQGSPFPIDRVIIEEDGTINLTGVPFDGDKARVRLPDGSIGWIQIQREGTGSRLLPWNWFD